MLLHSPHQFPDTAHPLIAFVPLQSLAKPPRWSRLYQKTSLAPGVLSPITPSENRVYLLRRFHPSAYVPSSGFLNLSTVFSSVFLAGLFHPTSVSGVLPSGFSLLEEPFHLSVKFALLSLLPPDLTTFAVRQRGNSPSGLCSLRESVVTSQCYSHRKSSIPSWAFPSLGSSPFRRGDRFRSPPLPCFAVERARPLHLRVLPNEKFDCVTRHSHPFRGSPPRHVT